MTKSQRLALKPEAATQTVEDLVALVQRGVVRIPTFQRGLRWQSEDVIALFDSIYRGYPVGSFLFRKGPAESAKVPIGPITIDAPATHAALWVVDGQQRVTALTAALSRPLPFPTTPIDVWVVYFDAAEQEFVMPSRNGEVPSTWVPVARLFDAAELSEWVHNWPHAGDASLRTAVFQAGARIRQFEVPMYVVETDDDQLLREIFYRINKSGKALEWPEVYDALFGHRGERPATLQELADDLTHLGMGRPSEDLLLQCLLSFKGLDVTRNIAEHYRRNPGQLESGIENAVSALRRVLSFLRRECEIPHLRLLPRSSPIVVLTRFFALFREPQSRTLELLSRWTWRALYNASFYDERTVLRHGVAGIDQVDEEASAQRVLTTVPREPRSSFALPSRFDARAADSRLALLGMSSLSPRRMENGEIIDIAALVEQHDIDAFRRIVATDKDLGRSPANRVLLPGGGTARKEILELAAREGSDSDVLRSHAINAEAIQRLIEEDEEGFLNERKKVLEDVVNAMAERLAAWSQSDRPSIGYILEFVGSSK
jgi:hypothetical protein